SISLTPLSVAQMSPFLDASSLAAVSADPSLEKEERLHQAFIRFALPCLLAASMEQRHSLVLALLRQLGVFLQVCEKYDRAHTLLLRVRESLRGGPLLTTALRPRSPCSRST